jgi:hypothetical protein
MSEAPGYAPHFMAKSKKHRKSARPAKTGGLTFSKMLDTI